MHQGYQHYQTVQAGPTLTLSPYAYLKLQFLLHRGDTEVGMFCVSSEANPLYVEDVVTLPQECSVAFVRFDPEGLADYQERMVCERKLPHERFFRIWLHTHPGSSPNPSGVDETNFSEFFDQCDWSVMLIISRTGDFYARLKQTRPVKTETALQVEVDWREWPAASEFLDLPQESVSWELEYSSNVRKEEPRWGHFQGHDYWRDRVPGHVLGFGPPGHQSDPPAFQKEKEKVNERYHLGWAHD